MRTVFRDRSRQVGIAQAHTAGRGTEWQIAAQACGAYSLVSLSLYDTLGPNVVEYCINHADARVVVASSAHIPALLQLAQKCPQLKVVICADSFKEIDGVLSKAVSAVPKSQVLKQWAADVGITLLGFEEGQSRQGR